MMEDGERETGAKESGCPLEAGKCPHLTASRTQELNIDGRKDLNFVSGLNGQGNSSYPRASRKEDSPADTLISALG